MESLPSMEGDEAKGHGDAISVKELDHKSLLVQVVSITDSSEKEVDFVEGGSMKENKTFLRFTYGANLFHIADSDHEGVASSIYSQKCQDTNHGGEAPTSETTGSTQGFITYIPILFFYSQLSFVNS